MLEQKHLDILEALDWVVEEEDEGRDQIEIGKYTPAGEDFSITIDTEGKDFPNAVYDAAWNFDPEEHADGWYNGPGAPSLHELVDDAEWIQKDLDKLATALLRGHLPEEEEKWEFTDEKANALREHVEGHFTVDLVHLISDIIQYIAEQGMDQLESVNLLMALLGSTGITREEINSIL